MKVILKTYKYRLLPNKEQEEILARYFGTVRFVYNHFLAERKNQYDKTGKSDNYYTQAKTLTNLKKQEEYSWIKEVNSQTLQQSLRHLETAYTNFLEVMQDFQDLKQRKMVEVLMFLNFVQLLMVEFSFQNSKMVLKL